jgi:large subunit ribosomal protein L10
VTKLNRNEKSQVVAEVVERLERTETIMTTDFRGLTVAQLAELRGKLRDAEAEMTVVKNTLSRRAADQTGRSALLPYLQGPTGLVWVNGDPAQAAKALSDFAKVHKEVFTIRGGVLGSDDLPTESIVRLASLPSREQMLAQLAGALASPISGLAGRLNGLIEKMARTLAAVRDSGSLAPGEAPVEATPAAVEVEAAPEATEAPAVVADAPVEDVAEAVVEAEAEAAPAEESPVEAVEDAPSEGAEAEEAASDTPAPDAPAEGEPETPES